MIHNVHFIRRRLEGKSSPMLMPLAFMSLGMLLAGLFIFFTNH